MIYVLDRFDAERFNPSVKTLAIRCMSSALARAQVGIKYKKLDKKLYIGILPLTFDDLTPRDLELNPGVYDSCVFFGRAHAERISDFLKIHRDKFKDIMTHCDFGKSRSCGIGGAIGDFFGWEYSDGIWTRCGRGPNMHVYNTLTEVFKERN